MRRTVAFRENRPIIVDVGRVHSAPVKAVLGPTNTGKTHYAVERLCAHSSGIMGFPLRLLAREVYDQVVAVKGAAHVGLITGEERIMPPGARWLLCTTESMPVDRDVAFVALDEAQLGIDPDRGHVFTDRLLHARGREETLILGSASLKPLVRTLLPETEVTARPRFSKLSYAAPKKISRLPPRTAIIAFSADEVYAIAEMVRRHCGGAAIVMGTLSPRTRNAQVEMYQSGEVDYIVATDAIGMGLNMDIGHVAFASLFKFDGTRRRRLTLPEMAQIAGRAGRHQRDGTFGIATVPGQDAEFTQEEIERIEDHRFAPHHWLYWRNTDLDFRSPDHLIAALEEPPVVPELRPAPEADDQTVLRNLMIDPDVTRLAIGESATRRLWDACGLPDFRSTGPDFHARLVSRLYQYLGAGDGHIPTEIIAAEVARLDSVQGNIPTLASRLAGIRTWTYAANRSDWLRDPAHWAARTRAVEEKLSDALHRQLTERFVDRRTAQLFRSRGTEPRESDFRVDKGGTVTLLDEPVGTLRGFRFSPDMDARSGARKRFLASAEAAIPRELERRAHALAGCGWERFTLRAQTGEAVTILWDGAPVATLQRGRGLLDPALALDSSVARLDVALREMVRTRLTAFVRQHIAHSLAPLERLTESAFSAATPPAIRAALAPLAEAGGAMLRCELDPVLSALDPVQRKRLRTLGIIVGSLAVFHPALLKPGATHLRLALEAIRSGQPMPPVPMAGLGLLEKPAPALAQSAARAGYYRFGDRMLRFDLLERMAMKVHERRSGHAPFLPDASLAASIGVGGETLARVLRELGFVPAGAPENGQWRWRGLRRSHGSHPGQSQARTAPQRHSAR